MRVTLRKGKPTGYVSLVELTIDSILVQLDAPHHLYRPDEKNLSMTDAVLGIDVSKITLDASLLGGTKPRSRSFANSPDGWRQLIAWLSEHRIRQVHACLEATGRYSLGIALALHEAGHVVSLVNPAQIRDFARTKLGRNKTDQVDATHIREYAELFKPRS